MTNGTGVSNNDGYAAQAYVNDAFYLTRVDDEVDTVIGSWGTPASATTYVIRLTCNGSGLVVNIDGTDRISTTDATYSSGGVGIFNGLYTAAMTSQHFLDNWEASDLVSGGSAVKPRILMLGD